MIVGVLRPEPSGTGVVDALLGGPINGDCIGGDRMCERDGE
jgi:hypothetical protein